MKSLTRYCSLFLVLLLLFVGFSIPVSAESVNTSPLEITQRNYINTKSYNSFVEYSNGLTFHPNNDEHETIQYFSLNNAYNSAFTLMNGFYFRSTYDVTYINDGVILESGKKSTVRFNNFYFSHLVEANYGSFYARQVGKITVTLFGAGKYSNSITLSDVRVTDNRDGSINIVFTAQPDFDVKMIALAIDTIEYKHNSTSTNYFVPIQSYFGEFNGDDVINYSIDIESEEVGLLKSVIEWLKGIKNGIADLFESIKELPNKLWNLIKEGLQSLFIPSEESVTEFKNKIDLMLENKLGAVYQVINLTFGSWDSINANDIKNTITIPLITINLPNGNTFSFGGFDVQVVPIGFEFIVDIIKGFVGIICTLLFIQGMRSKYDEVMGVEK